MSRNERNKVKKDWGKLEYNIPNNPMEALLLDKNNGNTYLVDDIFKEII